MWYFTSDTHFGSQRALELSKRPFASVEQMDNFMINQWNMVVHPGDVVFHLGDFGDIKALWTLHGNIKLIPGNYEWDNKDGYFDALKVYSLKADSNLQILDDDRLYIDLTYNTYGKDLRWKYKSLYLTHRPQDCIKDNPEIFNLFGHIHEKQMMKRYGLNVGVDCHHFRLVPMSDIYFYLNAFDKGYYDDNVFD